MLDNMILETCKSTHNMTALSIFSAASSGCLFITTVPLNALIIYCISKKQDKRKLFFYKLLLNIAVADLLKGIFGDVSSIVWHTREAIGAGQKYWTIDVRFVHISLFIPDGVALVSMTILSVDRIYALLAPYQYFRGYLHPRTENIIVLLTYPISIAILTPYFVYSYIKQLVIFFGCTHSIAVTSLILLILIYRHKYKRPVSKTSTSSFNESATGSINMSMTSLDHDGGSSCEKKRKRGVSLAEENTNTSNAEESKLTKQQLKRNKSAPVLSPKKSVTVPQQQMWSDLQHQHQHQHQNVLQLHEEVSVEAINHKNNKNNKNTIEGEKYLCDADPCTITTTIENNKTFPSGNTAYLQQQQRQQKTADHQQGQQRKTKRSASLLNSDFFVHLTRATRTSTSSSNYSRTKTERRVTRTFLIMLVVFIVTYLPTCIMVILMNTKERHCKVTHVLRDLSVLGILSSSLFRALNFIFTLKHLKREVLKLLNFKRIFTRQNKP